MDQGCQRLSIKVSLQTKVGYTDSCEDRLHATRRARKKKKKKKKR